MEPKPNTNNAHTSTKGDNDSEISEHEPEEVSVTAEGIIRPNLGFGIIYGENPIDPKAAYAISQTAYDTLYNAGRDALRDNAGPTPDIFTGELGKNESVGAFLADYDVYADLLRWTPEVKAKRIVQFLKKDARIFATTWPPDIATDYDEIVAALKAQYQPGRIDDVYSMAFHTKKQGPRESVTEFGRGVQSTGRMAYPSADPETLNKLILRIFVQNLKPLYRRDVFARNFATFEEAFVYAQSLECAYQMDYLGMGINEQVAHVDPIQPKEDNSLRNTVDSLKADIQSLKNIFNGGPMVTNHAPAYYTGAAYPEFSQYQENRYNALPRNNGNMRGYNLDRRPPRDFQFPMASTIQNRRSLPVGQLWNEYTVEGRPICNSCRQPGHVRAMCPNRRSVVNNSPSQFRSPAVAPINRSPASAPPMAPPRFYVRSMMRTIPEETEKIPEVMDSEEAEYLAAMHRDSVQRSTTFAGFNPSVNCVSLKSASQLKRGTDSFMQLPRRVHFVLTFVVIFGFLVSAAGCTLSDMTHGYATQVHEGMGVALAPEGLLLTSGVKVYIPIISYTDHLLLHGRYRNGDAVSDPCTQRDVLRERITTVINEKKQSYEGLLDTTYYSQLLGDICRKDAMNCNLTLNHRTHRSKRVLPLLAAGGLVGAFGLGSIGFGIGNSVAISKLASKVQALEEAYSDIYDQVEPTVYSIRKMIKANKNVYVVMPKIVDHMNQMEEELWCHAERDSNSLRQLIVSLHLEQEISSLIESVMNAVLRGEISPTMIDLVQVRKIIDNDPVLRTTLLKQEPHLMYSVARAYPVDFDIAKLRFSFIFEVPVIHRENVLPLLSVHNVGFNDVTTSRTYRISLPHFVTANSGPDLRHYFAVDDNDCKKITGILICPLEALRAQPDNCLGALAGQADIQKECSFQVTSLNNKSEVVVTHAGVLLRTREDFATISNSKAIDLPVHGTRIKVKSNGVLWKSFYEFSILYVGGQIVPVTSRQIRVSKVTHGITNVPKLNLTDILTPFDFTELNVARSYTAQAKELISREMKKKMSIHKGTSVSHGELALFFSSVAVLMSACTMLNCLWTLCKNWVCRGNGRQTLVTYKRVSEVDLEPEIQCASFEATASQGRASQKLKRDAQCNTETNPTLMSKVKGVGVKVIATINNVLSSTIKLPINGFETRCLIDTGADLTVITKAFYERIRSRIPKIARLRPDEIEEVGGFGGHTVAVIGSCVLEFEFTSFKVKQNVLVVNQGTHDCIVGNNLLELLGDIHFNLTRKIVTICGKIYQLGEGSDEGPRVKLTKNVIIPPKTQMVVYGKVARTLNTCKDILFEPIGKLFLKHPGLMIATALVLPPLTGIIPVCLVNQSNVSLILHKNTTLGYLEDTFDPLPCDSSQPEMANISVRLDNTEVPGLNFFTSDAFSSPEDFKKRLPFHLQELNLDLKGVPTKIMERLLALLWQFQDVFARFPGDIGLTSLVEHGIDTGDHKPIKSRPRREMPAARKEIKQLVDQMLEQDVIEPSDSPWSHNITLVPKKDGAIRFCVDLRDLNSITKKDAYPLPHPKELLDCFSTAVIFSVLDCEAGYNQVKLQEQDKQKTAFSCSQGFFHFKRMCFGLCNAPATFQRLMDAILSGLHWKFANVYIDDLIVYSKTLEKHIDHLREVFLRVRKAGLKLKPKKCFIFQEHVEYLGLVVSPQGIKPSKGKIEAINDYPTPKDVTQVRSFLGLANFFRQFIPNMSEMTAPIRRLLKKNADFVWDPSCDKAKEYVVEKLTTAPCLIYPDFEKPFLLYTDASREGLGCVLSQVKDGAEHPIGFASRHITPAEKNYTITELEGLAVVWSLKYFKHYLYGKKVTIFTDHSALLWLLTKAEAPTGRLARWQYAILEFDFEIKHKPGKSQSHVDALSRNPLTRQSVHEIQADMDKFEKDFEHKAFIAAVHQVNQDSTNPEDSGDPANEETNVSIAAQQADLVDSEDHENVRDRLFRSQLGDQDFHDIIVFKQSGRLPRNLDTAKKVSISSERFLFENGVLFHLQPFEKYRREGIKQLLCVPLGLRNNVLNAAHDELVGGGHFGIPKTLGKILEKYWWPTVTTDVTKHVKSCVGCNTRKGPLRLTKQPLVPLPISAPFARIHMDVAGKYTQTEDGNRYILVIICAFTKWTEAYPMPDQKAVTIAKVFMKEFVCRFGVPVEVLTDRGTNFIGQIMTEVYAICGSMKLTTTAYHQQTNGQVERMNQTLIRSISIYAADRRVTTWDQILPYTLFSYRTAIQSSTRDTPFFLVFGRDPLLPFDLTHTLPNALYVDNESHRDSLIRTLDFAWRQTRENIERAQQQQKQQYDKTTHEPAFAVGSIVYRYYPGNKKPGISRKFQAEWHGPMRIVEMVGKTDAKIVPLAQPRKKAKQVHLNNLFLALAPDLPALPVPSDNDAPSVTDENALSDDSHEL